MKLKPNMKSDFDEFLKEDNIYDDVNDIAIKRVIAYQLEQEMKAQSITKKKMAEMMQAEIRYGRDEKGYGLNLELVRKL